MRIISLGNGIRLAIVLTAISLVFMRAAADTSEIPSMIFVVDRSGSMDAELPEIKATIERTVKRYPPNHAFGLMAFDGCGASQVEYMVKIAPGTADEVMNTVGQIQSAGATDIAAAFAEMKAITDSTGTCPTVVIFTDNMDTCGGDIDGIKVSIAEACAKVSFVTSSMNEDVVGYFQELAEISGGHVYSGRESAAEKMKALEEIKKQEAKDREYSVSRRGSTKPGDGGTPPTPNPDPSAKERERKQAGAGSGSTVKPTPKP